MRSFLIGFGLSAAFCAALAVAPLLAAVLGILLLIKIL